MINLTSIENRGDFNDEAPSDIIIDDEPENNINDESNIDNPYNGDDESYNNDNSHNNSDNDNSYNNNDNDSSEPVDPIEHEKMVLLLSFYNIEFPVKLKDIMINDLRSLTYNELNELKERYDYVLGIRSNVGAGVSAFTKGIFAIEQLACKYTPAKLEGLSQICNDPELIDDVKLLIIQNSNLIKTTPQARIAYKVLSSALLLHKVNSAKEEIQLKTESATDGVDLDTLNEKFDDL